MTGEKKVQLFNTDKKNYLLIKIDLLFMYRVSQKKI